VARASAELRVLEQLVPTENGITGFEAEGQETSYGIWFIDDLPFIPDTPTGRTAGASRRSNS